MLKKILSGLILGLLLGVVGLVAVSKDDLTVITYANWQFLEPGRGEVLRQFIAEFEKEHPNIRVEPMAIPYSVYSDAITTQFEAGAGPDILFVQDLAWFPWLARGYFAPLDKLIDLHKYKDEFTDMQWKICSKDGLTYGIIYEGFVYNALIINRRLLQEAGVDYIPKTPEELLAASETVAKALGVWGLIHPTDVSAPTYIMQGAMIVINGFGGRIVDPETGRFAVNSPEFIKGVEFNAKIFQSLGTPLGTPFGQQRAAFLEGKAAMVLDGSYWPAICALSAPDVYKDLLVVPAPFPEPTGPFEFNVYAINAYSPEDKQRAAAAFLEFLLQPERANRWAVESAIPGLKFTYDAVIQAYPWFKVYADLAPYGVVRPVPGHEEDTLEILKIIADYVGMAGLGLKTPQEAMDECQRVLEERFGR